MCRIPDDRFHALARHPGWAELKAEAHRARTQYFQNLANVLYTQGLDSLTAEDFAYRRGFFRGMQWLLTQPDFSAAALERALKQQQDGDNA